MMSAAKVGNFIWSVKPNSLCRRAIVTKSPLCCDSNSNDNNGRDQDKKNTENEKPKTVPHALKNKSKFKKYSIFRNLEALETVEKLMKPVKPNYNKPTDEPKENQEQHKKKNKKPKTEVETEFKKPSNADVAEKLKVSVKYFEPKRVVNENKRSKLLQAVKAAAVELGGTEDESICNDLLSAYKKIEDISMKPQKPSHSARKDETEYKDLPRFSSIIDEPGYKNTYEEPVFLKKDVYNIFSINVDVKLNIFNQDDESSEVDVDHDLKLWKVLELKELMNLSLKPPKNYFEQLINWTQQGKLWHFPIDNEQGLDEEINTDFSEHIFLEKHLEPWCPKFGPLRHFMELVTTGLSKNPYLTVAEKKEHIYWYRDYFEQKKKLLVEVGAIPTTMLELEKGEQ